MIKNISINIEKTNKYPIVKIKGEIDIYTCGEFRTALSSLVKENTTHFIIDLSELNYIDSTGLGTIAHSARTIDPNNGHIYIICQKPQIKKIFEVSGLQKKNISLFEKLEDIELLEGSND